MKNILVLFGSLLFCQNVFATTWSVDSVLSGGDGGFGYSSMHDATGASPMSGTELVEITSASGTYNDVSGALSLVLGLSNLDNMTLMGNLKFVAGILSIDSSLTYSGLANLAALTLSDTDTLDSHETLDASGSFGFRGEKVCCSGSLAPNSFKPVGDLSYLTLWGADYGVGDFVNDGGLYTGSKIGMDLRLELSPVPVPAAFYLFGSALLGLIGWRRRNLGATAS